MPPKSISFNFALDPRSAWISFSLRGWDSLRGGKEKARGGGSLRVKWEEIVSMQRELSPAEAMLCMDARVLRVRSKCNFF